MITFEGKKGLYYFGYELKLLKEIGFKFPKIKKCKNEFSYKVLKNPMPIRATQRRKKLLEELPFKMNAIEVIWK